MNITPTNLKKMGFKEDGYSTLRFDFGFDNEHSIISIGKCPFIQLSLVIDNETDTPLFLDSIEEIGLLIRMFQGYTYKKDKDHSVMGLTKKQLQKKEKQDKLQVK